MIEKLEEEEEHGIIDKKEAKKIKLTSTIISIVIVLFNKFVIAKVIHTFVDYQKIPIKSDFNITYA
jgi:hypothetical protein